MDDGGCCGTGAGERPLPVLLSRAESAFVAAFEKRLADSEFGDVSLAHSANVLRFLMEGPRRASQLVGVCGVSKQAVSQQISQLERRGYIAAVPDPADQRARILQLTDRGVAAERRIRQIFGEVEEAWANGLGARDSAALRRILEKITGL
ncbi:MAG: MarR family winged helix-turn-helix transcriptional regulator [Marmoricola sp.]